MITLIGTVFLGRVEVTAEIVETGGSALRAFTPELIESTQRAAVADGATLRDDIEPTARLAQVRPGKWFLLAEVPVWVPEGHPAVADDAGWAP